mgnify:CR=1 FL=1
MPDEKEQEAGAGEAAQLMPDDASVEPAPPGADGLVRQPTTDGGKARRKALQARMQPDEYAMTVGIVNIMVTSFVVGRAPESFFIVHLIKTAVLLPWRFFSWRRRREHWYLVEFCYFVSYMTLIGCFLALLRTSTGYESPLAEHAGVIFRVGFSFSTGMVLWSVFIFRNSIVLHDVDQLTSTFIHLSPPILFWCWRWGGGLGPSVVHQTWPGMLQICGDRQLFLMNLHWS